jgi:hypothetical protein
MGTSPDDTPSEGEVHAGQKRKRKMREALSRLLCYTVPCRAQTRSRT